MFHLNGQPCSPSAADNTPLLAVLRGECGLSGAKFGCGQGECGACMVLVDGQPQTACNLPLWAVQGKQVTTLEGLGMAEKPHPLQAAFLAANAAQCGHCVAGIIISAAAPANPSWQVGAAAQRWHRIPKGRAPRGVRLCCCSANVPELSTCTHTATSRPRWT